MSKHHEYLKIEQLNSAESKCPFLSERVVCNSCGSSNFSIDSNGQRKNNNYKVPGRCDDCGHTVGIKVK